MIGWDLFALSIGYTVMVSAGFGVILVLVWLLYQGYDYWLKKWLGWNENVVRDDIFYFIKHAAEIRQYIKTKKRFVK